MTWIIFCASSLSTSLGTPDDPRRPLCGFQSHHRCCRQTRERERHEKRRRVFPRGDLVHHPPLLLMTFSSFVALDEPGGSSPSSRVPASIPTALLFGSTTPSSLTARARRAFFGSAELHARVRAGPIERTRRRGRG